MYWTLELASRLEDAPFPATKEELLDYAIRSGMTMKMTSSMIPLKTSGPTILLRKISFSTRKSTSLQNIA